MISFKKLVAVPVMAAILVAGCSTAGATQSPTAPPAAASSSAASSSAASSSAASSSAATSSATVVAVTAGSNGTVLAAGSNGKTVYTFTNDKANSGTSACTGACLVKWPALTVPAGTTPTGGPGVTGKLGTITRADDATLEVTYNGLPLYFYIGDKAPGDTTGSYPNWNLVKP
jgi:predicted lipoprotein with Yx(FWY)xxD motif